MQLGGLQLHIHWVPSHLDWKQMGCPFEDWCCEWNNRIDRIVSHFNTSRPSAFWKLQQAAQLHHDQVCRRLRQLRAFFFALAAARRAGPSSTEDSEIDSLDFGFVDDHHVSVHDLITEDLHSLVSLSGWPHRRIPSEFMVTLLQWIVEQSHADCAVYPVSFIELTGGFCF